jgi:hypothetical protein
MKKYCIFSFVFILFMWSCSGEESIKGKEDQSIEEQQIWKTYQKIKKEKLNLRVEHATIEEMNKVLLENNLPPVSEKLIEESKQSLEQRSSWPCAVWVYYGDFNNDNVLSTLDVVLAQQHMCGPVNNCNGCSSIYNCGQINSEGINFAVTSYLWSGLGYQSLDGNDIYAAQRYILGVSGCF